MASNKIDKKVRLFTFLPYGFCSKDATIIAGKNNEYAASFHLGDDPAAFLDYYENYKKNIRDKALYLIDKGYAKNVKRSCGTPPQVRSFRILTQKGLAILTDAPDVLPEGTPISSEPKDYTESKNDGYFRSNSATAISLRQMLIELAQSDDPADQKEFDTILADAVMNGDVTALTEAIALANSAVISMDKYSSNQRYRIWCLSHIVAMFASWGFLTYLDKRPYDTHFAIDRITDEASLQTYLSKHGNAVPALIFRTLNRWYSNNPGFYRITQQYPDESLEAKEDWLATPAFYSADELPMCADAQHASSKEDILGSQQRFFSSYLGLAVGEKVNYAVFHANPGEFKWYPGREERARRELEKAIARMKAQNPEISCPDNVNFALYFCTSYHQFLAFFAASNKKQKKPYRTKHIVNDTYLEMFVVPVNDSGAALLNCLLNFGADVTEREISESLIRTSRRFSRCNRFCFPLYYDDKLVFCGHTMNVRKIHQALHFYNEGYRFSIACFPDQVSWYKHLFPEAQFI